jgi:TolA-binding protein
MKPAPDLYRTAVSAYRELTAAGEAVAATRARILAAAGRHGRPRQLPGRVALLLGAAMVAIASTSLAAAALAGRWRAPPPEMIAWTPPTEPSAFPAARRRAAVAQPAPADRDRPPSAERPDAEAEIYGRAHQIHFAGHAPARALAAWDEYLARFPRGTFAPEARYNRALCLIPLGRFAQAETALRAFADGRFGDYRQTEAAQLLAWLHARRVAP